MARADVARSIDWLDAAPAATSATSAVQWLALKRLCHSEPRAATDPARHYAGIQHQCLGANADSQSTPSLCFIDGEVSLRRIASLESESHEPHLELRDVVPTDFESSWSRHNLAAVQNTRHLVSKSVNIAGDAP